MNVDDDVKTAELFKKCADRKLPDDFADRLLSRIKAEEKASGRFSHRLGQIALLAASITLLCGFVPGLVRDMRQDPAQTVMHVDGIQPARHALPESELTGWAMLGLCREVIRRRVRPLFQCFRRREAH